MADGEAEVDLAVPLAELSGLRSLRGGVSGSVRGSVRFSREQGVAVAELTLHGAVTLECQRCLRPLTRTLDTRTRIALVASEAQAPRVPADLEPVLAAGGRISMAELITEELLLTLPIVPLHGGAEECGSASVSAPTPEQGGETHRPFASLAELLKR